MSDNSAWGACKRMVIALDFCLKSDTIRRDSFNVKFEVDYNVIDNDDDGKNRYFQFPYKFVKVFEVQEFKVKKRITLMYPRDINI